jgi:hypothetical protein
MNHIRIATLCAVALVLAGCGKNKMLEAAENYEKEACACKDAACATTASTKFAEETKKNASSAPTSGSDAEAYSKAVQKATECVTKAAMSNMPTMPNMPAMPGAPPAKK